MINLGECKIGNTFSFYANIKDPKTNLPLIGKASKLKSQIRDHLDNLMAELTITETDTQGQYLFSTNATDNWDIGICNVDIKYEENGIRSSTDTFQVTIIPSVTKS